MSPEPEFVSYQTSNRLLVIGNDAELEAVLTALDTDFRISWWPDDSHTPSKPGIELLHIEDNAQLTGFLGNFSISDNPETQFDQVMDFQSQPVIKSRIPPFGYYHISNRHNLEKIIAGVKEMIGIFDKPKYFRLDLSKCAHQQSGITGCHNCLDVCATDAIRSESGKISVNPYLCQGCGDCTSVCPSGAISYQYPTRDQIFSELKAKLVSQAGIILFHTGGLQTDLALPAPIIPYQVEALGLIGLDYCLTTLVLGATQLWLFDNGELTPETQSTINTVVTQSNQILFDLGFPKNLVQLTKADEFVVNLEFSITKALYQPSADKRTAIRMATDHLREQAKQQPEFTQFSSPAAFGTLQLNRNACTLCMACVSVCPAQALSAGNEMPQLKFFESQCLQCGICQQACPEQAIALEPRFMFDSVAARKPRLLYEEKPFYCINCKKPFATESMINTILQKLQHHPMFQGADKQQLLLCEDCKAAALFNKS